MNTLKNNLLPTLVAISCFFAQVLYADATLVGLTTDGAVQEINQKTGVLKLLASQSSNYELGAIARQGKLLYSVAVPPSSAERALYKANLKSGVVSIVDLDRNDAVSALFFQGKKLFGIFSDDTIGSAGVYRINLKTGVTTLVVDLGAVDLDFVGGAIARVADKFYTIGVDYANARRVLVEFKLKRNSQKSVPILDKNGNAILCDRIKPHPSKSLLVCMAGPSATQVDIFQIKPKTGVATIKATLAGIDRVGGGHTMMRSGNKFFALVYASGESNNQRLVSFNANGKQFVAPAVAGIFIGARFGAEDDT